MEPAAEATLDAITRYHAITAVIDNHNTPVEEQLIDELAANPQLCFVTTIGLSNIIRVLLEKIHLMTGVEGEVMLREIAYGIHRIE